MYISDSEQDKYKNIQDVILPYITSAFFPWVCIILLLNHKNWNRPVILILVIHWFLRSTGDVLRNTMAFRTEEPGTAWPNSKMNWYISNGIAHIFWLSGEIIGDWYPLLRTKAVTNNRKRMIFVYLTCIFYNFVKLFGMYCFFLHNPIDLRLKSFRESNGNVVTKVSSDLRAFKSTWWITVMVMHIASILYDGSVIYTLKKILFDKLKDYQSISKNSFMERFKQISEYRIFFSMIASVIFLILDIPFFIFILFGNMNDYVYASEEENQIEALRQVVLTINYTLMYVDQILLRRYAEKGKNSSKIKNSSNSSSSFKSNYQYKKLNKFEDSEFSRNSSNLPNTSQLLSYSYTGKTDTFSIQPTKYSNTNDLFSEQSDLSFSNSNYSRNISSRSPSIQQYNSKESTTDTHTNFSNSKSYRYDYPHTRNNSFNYLENLKNYQI